MEESPAYGSDENREDIGLTADAQPTASESATGEPAASDLSEQLISQVAAIETEAQQADNSEVQSRVNHLISLIKTHLKTQTLSPQAQRELARLLSLTHSFDNRHAQQLSLLDLAVSILIESDESDPAKSENGSPRDTSSRTQNLVFAQETRRQIARQSRIYPNPLSAIVTGNSTPYIRLISGLSWFFFIFAIVPLAISGITLAVWNVMGFAAAKVTVDQLRSSNILMKKESDRQETQIETLTRRRDALAAQLGRTGSLLTEITQADASLDSEEAGTDRSSAEISVELGTLSAIQAEIEGELRSNVNRVVEADALDVTGEAAEETGNVPDSTDDPAAPEVSGDKTKAEKEADAKAKALLDAASRLTDTSFPFFWLAISMGALGSTVSVIVRANTFIHQAQETDNDLFLTGFFRPFVGMSFAIFCVALVEAGIFSGLVDVTKREDANRTYFYVAIAFVAGFSERLVRDVVIKTEDTLAGPSSRDR